MTLTHRAGEAPKHRAPGCYRNKNLDDRATRGVLHPLTVLREGVYLNHQEALQHRCVHLGDLEMKRNVMTTQINSDYLNDRQLMRIKNSRIHGEWITDQ